MSSDTKPELGSFSSHLAISDSRYYGYQMKVPRVSAITRVDCIVYYRNLTRIRGLIIWLAPRAGKTKRILFSDWLPERARWAYLARSGLPALVPQKRNSVGVIFWPYNESFIDQSCAVKMAGYWPRSFLRFYGPRLHLGP